MPRVWITCALVTAAVVALVVLLSNRPPAEANGPKAPQPPSPLTEQEIRGYINVMPELRDTLGTIAIEYQTARVRAGGELDEAAETALKVKSQGLVDALLGRRGLTRDSWQQLYERVEYAVHAVRMGMEFETARPEIEEKIGNLRKALADPAQKGEARVIEREIRELEMILEHKGLPLLDRDRELIRRYWRDLDAAVPRRGPPPREPPR